MQASSGVRHGTGSVGCAFTVPMRFQVRKGTKGWLVWDNEAKAIAVVDHYQAVGLSAETANQFAKRLNKLHEAVSRLRSQSDRSSSS